MGGGGATMARSTRRAADLARLLLVLCRPAAVCRKSKLLKQAPGESKARGAGRSTARTAARTRGHSAWMGGRAGGGAQPGGRWWWLVFV